MTAALFLAFIAATALVVIASAWRFGSPRSATLVSAGLPLWLLYAGIISLSGVLVAVPGRPPGLLLIVIPVFLFVALVLVRSQAAGRAALALPLGVLIGTQSFRIIVELFLNQLALDGLAPRMLTFQGANFDLWIGVSAPFVAWLTLRGTNRRFALVWNMLGLLSLANVITRSVLTAPGPLHLLHTEVPNLIMSTFPYSYVPAFLAPLAITLHVLCIPRLRAVRREPETQTRQAARA